MKHHYKVVKRPMLKIYKEIEQLFKDNEMSVYNKDFWVIIEKCVKLLEKQRRAIKTIRKKLYKSKKTQDSPKVEQNKQKHTKESQRMICVQSDLCKHYNIKCKHCGVHYKNEQCNDSKYCEFGSCESICCE